MKVLIVDYDRDVRSLLKLVLNKQGHEIVEHFNGDEAYQACLKDNFPLIIMDWELSGLSGVELCRKIRALPFGDYIVILMFTGRSSPEDLQRILDAGADDYIQKPVDMKWLKIRLKIALNNAEIKTARWEAEQQLADARNKEIETGSRIQQSLLLGKPPTDVPGVQIAAFTIPSQKVDGDFYDFYLHHQDCLDIVIGDVMGKGIPAALIGAAIKKNILHAISHLKSASQGKPPPLNHILTYVQKEVSDRLIELNKFVTLCYARFYLTEKRMEYINCGHTRMIYSNQADHGCVEIDNTNLPIGVVHDEEYKVSEMHFSLGDVFLMYSDGITETRCDKGEFFGEERLMDAVSKNSSLHPELMIRRINGQLKRFSQTGKAHDDQTYVSIRILDKDYNLPEIQIFETTSELNHLKSIREFVSTIIDHTASKHPIQIDKNLLTLSINEAASNIIRHAYHKQPHQPLRVVSQRFDNRIEFYLEHYGIPFSQPTLDTQGLDIPRENGMGLHIMDEIMDEVEYLCNEDGLNIIRLCKYFSKVN